MNSHINSKLCPFVKKPFTDCYCFNLTSRDINSAIHYCSSDFKSCDIYKRGSDRQEFPPPSGRNERQGALWKK